MGVVLNYGQIPLIKSRYWELICNEEQSYGVNAIVAIMSYTGYNVEDAILINEGSVKRGIFRTTYFSMYEENEESSKVTGGPSSKFVNIEKNNVIRKKQGYDYSQLDDYGLIRENTELNDKMILIGKVNSNMMDKDVWIDDSKKPKKGQLGFVDKSFITLGEEGFNIAKVRVREERLPAIGDKMASRSGQKGTIGLIIPEEDMPFTDDGVRPDLIINPHAIPSRMTIGQIVECLFGKVCVNYGAFGDCTSFQVKGPNHTTYGPLLVNAGFHSSGNQLLYNGMNGEQLEANIYIGPTYYLRLKHMVKDKINYRARGPNTALTRQPVQGRANDGGLRIGEMERDGLLSHGMSYFLNESFMIRGEKPDYKIAVCNKSGAIAIYNESRNLFLSPFADGPVQFNINDEGNQYIRNVSRFGRSFSILKVPYAFKLLMQELQVMNIQMRIITDQNVDKLLNMTYSNNIQKLLKSDKSLTETITQYKSDVRNILNKSQNSYSNITADKPDVFESLEVPGESFLNPSVIPPSDMNGDTLRLQLPSSSSSPSSDYSPKLFVQTPNGTLKTPNGTIQPFNRLNQTLRPLTPPPDYSPKLFVQTPNGTLKTPNGTIEPYNRLNQTSRPLTPSNSPVGFESPVYMGTNEQAEYTDRPLQFDSNSPSVVSDQKGFTPIVFETIDKKAEPSSVLDVASDQSLEKSDEKDSDVRGGANTTRTLTFK
jgi:hypothetical protein